MPIATKPPFRKYVAPPTTEADIEYCNLRTIKLSQVDSPIPEEREAVYQEFKRAVREDGFFFLEDFGLTQEQVSRGQSRERDLTSDRHAVCDRPARPHRQQHYTRGEGAATVEVSRHWQVHGVQAPRLLGYIERCQGQRRVVQLVQLVIRRW